MRIADGIHVVMSGALGFDLTDRYDCSVFLIRAGSEWLLFDAGAGRAVDEALAIASEEGIDPRSIRHLFLTHAHADHSGGAAALRAALDVTVHAAPATAEMVSAGDERGISLDVAKRAGIYPADYLYRPCPVDRVTRDGDRFRLGSTVVETIASPGHSGDHVCYLVTSPEHRILVAGDAVFAGGRVALQDTWDCSVAQSCETIRQLAGIDFATLLPGHGAVSLKGGRRYIETARSYVDRLLPPPNLV